MGHKPKRNTRIREGGENITFELRSSEESCNKTEMELEQSYTLGGNVLEHIIAPGDVLFVSSGQGVFSAMGPMDVVVGHVLLIASPLRRMTRRSTEAKQFGKIWPQDGPS